MHNLEDLKSKLSDFNRFFFFYNIDWQAAYHHHVEHIFID